MYDTIFLHIQVGFNPETRIWYTVKPRETMTLIIRLDMPNTKMIKKSRVLIYAAESVFSLTPLKMWNILFLRHFAVVLYL